jgi:hypothetical protein
LALAAATGNERRSVVNSRKAGTLKRFDIVERSERRRGRSDVHWRTLRSLVVSGDWPSSELKRWRSVETRRIRSHWKTCECITAGKHLDTMHAPTVRMCDVATWSESTSTTNTYHRHIGTVYYVPNE